MDLNKQKCGRYACDYLDSIITKGLKYTETITLCNILWWPARDNYNPRLNPE